ncbi:MAG: putative rRNA maturation factor [Rikenellaceae bacterium]|nr:putative rRNA maturation factor [Rikenellaceae bacterium]
MAIIFNNFDKISSLLSENFYNNIKDIISKILSDYRFKEGKISIKWLNDNELLEINKNFLAHDYYTDVISFSEIKDDYLFAEIFISYERLMENAKILNQPINEEAARLIIHGILHSCGESDSDDINKRDMRAKEDYYITNLKKFN